VVGFAAIGLAWRHSSRTNQLWVQNQEFLSGGIGGLGLILVGVGLLIRDRLGRNQVLLAKQLAALFGRGEASEQPTSVVEGEAIEPAASEAGDDDLVPIPPAGGENPSVARRGRRTKLVK
jgi:hypothetical protein